MKKILFAVAVIVSVAFVAVSWAGSTGFNGIKLTPGANDTYTIQAQDTSGTDTLTLTAAGALTLGGELTLSTQGITGYSEAMPLTNWMKSVWVVSPMLADSYGNITSASAGPYLYRDNGVWSIFWNASDTASIAFPMKRVKPWVAGSNIAWRVLARWTGTYSTPTQASKYLQWSLQVNTEDSTIQTASTAMTAVAITPITTASQVTYELVPSAAAQASLISGAWYTLMIGPSAHNVASGTGAGNLFILGIEEYTP